MTFLREVRVELNKVSWPNRQQIVQYTLTVIGITLFLAIFLGVVDSVFTYTLNTLVK